MVVGGGGGGLARVCVRSFVDLSDQSRCPVSLPVRPELLPCQFFCLARAVDRSASVSVRPELLTCQLLCQARAVDLSASMSGQSC